MFGRTLQYKVSLYLSVVLVAVMLLFVALLVKQEREEQLRNLVTPLVAAVAMSLSSIVVVANALRLQHPRGEHGARPISPARRTEWRTSST